MVETIVEAELALQAFVDAVVGDLVTDRGTDIDAWYASIKDDDPVERLVKLYNALDSADQRTRHGAAERMGRGYNAARTEFFRKYNELVEAKVNLALEAEKDPIKITRLLLTTTIEKQTTARTSPLRTLLAIGLAPLPTQLPTFVVDAYTHRVLARHGCPRLASRR